jgi:hypothetical protein
VASGYNGLHQLVGDGGEGDDTLPGDVGLDTYVYRADVGNDKDNACQLAAFTLAICAFSSASMSVTVAPLSYGAKK